MNTYRATLEQLEPIADLFDQYRQFYKQEPNLDGCRDYIRRRLENDESVIFVAQSKEGEIVAFTQLYHSFCSVAMQEIIHLYDLFVSPKARRQGVGILLMDEAKTYAQTYGADRLVLETAVDNVPAQALYESIGYERDLDFYTYQLGLGPT
ncbi:MAG: ribosomal protein S18 acetylase RimI-like enzyme [Cellvibrionaceae bacterium]|jgi:ribosomal protein S18 acetylase RimI-like enzyme